MSVSTNVVWNDPDADNTPLVLSRIVKGGDDGTCAIAAWGMGLVVTYDPAPGFIGQDSCGYKACEDMDGDGNVSTEETTIGRCVSATVRISVENCVTESPTANPTRAPTTPMVSLQVLSCPCLWHGVTR